jgi:hypothetical protein
MSDASDKLDRNRQAILEFVARRQRKHDPHEEPPARRDAQQAFAPEEQWEEEEPYAGDGGWFGHLRHVVRTWWRYHPGNMVVELASPLLRNYAQRKPAQLVGISFAAGAVLMFLRPWKLISITGIIVALLKSSQLSHVLSAAMSAADYRKDQNRPD